jgi:hypothetical protein
MINARSAPFPASRFISLEFDSIPLGRDLPTFLAHDKLLGAKAIGFAGGAKTVTLDSTVAGSGKQSIQSQ